MEIIVTKHNEKPIDLSVIFVGLKDGEQAPRFAAYRLDTAGRPVKKLGGYDGKALKIDIDDAVVVAFGPDVDDFKELPKESLISYRLGQKIDLWRKQGLFLPRDIWDRFHFHFACVTGTARKCRPWFWDRIDDIRLKPMFDLAQVARIKPITAELHPHLHFPLSCQPLCDGIVEIYERECCCHHIHIPNLLDRLRDILDILPIPIPDPFPEPFPGPVPNPFPPGPGPGPRPGPDFTSFAPQVLRAKARAIQQRKTPLDLAAVPSENLHQDYLALRAMPVDAARVYVLERPYLFPIFCHCSVRKVGQTPIQPGGQFDFCYRRVHHHPHHGHCVTTYAYKIKQLINGVLTVVYDGLAAHQYFGAGGPADIRSYNPQARVCADGPGDPPPNDGAPFVMLEHIGSYGSFHFNFPAQTGVSQVGALGTDDGTYTTSYAPDCPWGGGLGLRLWFSPELEPIVKYYRLKAVAVNDAGMPVGVPKVLNDTVTWDKLVDIPGDLIRVSEVLGPVTLPGGTENDLFAVPYWSSPNQRYLSGQFHQVWNTAAAPTLFPDGKYILIIEVFDAEGKRVKPVGATGLGIEKNFQFRRWTSASDTGLMNHNNPLLPQFADAAHVFWVDNTPVGGDIVDLRKNGAINTAECQFMTQKSTAIPPDPDPSTFAIGFKAFHVHGVEHAGNGDDNSFMSHYGITWQRGLNGATGTLGAAPSAGNNHTDVGEDGVAVASGSETFANMLTKIVTLPDGTPTISVLPKCTFSVTLHVYAKHFTGSGRIQDYDYHETASFALEIAS